jgi:hypothetical protein
MFPFWRYLSIVGLLLVLPATYATGTSTSSQLVIYSMPEDARAADYLSGVLREVVGRQSSVVNLSGVGPLMEVAISPTPAGIIVLEWPPNSIIAREIRERIASLGPAPPKLVHMVSKAQYGLRISLSDSDRRTLMGKRYGLFRRRTPTEEDALNLFRAVDAYPCPSGGDCRNYDLDEQVQRLLRSQIHAFFLTAYCPNSHVELVQQSLGTDFDLIEIPPNVVDRMRRMGNKPYTTETFDPRKCRYPVRRGRTQTAGVPGLHAARPGLPSDIARDVATALRAKPPVNPDDFVRVVRRLDTMLPLHTDARRVYETRR